MKKIFRTKYLTSLCFLALLSVMFWKSIPGTGLGLIYMAKNVVDTGEINFFIVEETYNTHFKGKYFFINLNGAYQKMMGARTINERYLLDNGHLTYVIGEYDMEGIAQNTIEFRDALNDRNIPMVYVNTPFKINQRDKQLPANVNDYSNENANSFLDYLRKEDVTVLDLRENIARSNLNHYDMFYKTDHHWKAEAGLWAAGEITKFLSTLDDDFAVESSLLDPSNYGYEVHDNIFLGSAGKRVGEIYAGMDDFTVITPVFETDLSFSRDNGEVVCEGCFSDVFIDRDVLYSNNRLTSNTYSTYLGRSFSQIRILNQKTTSISPKKILLIRDSFSDVLIPFISLGYAQVDALDLRSFTGNLMDYIDECSPDIVLVVYNPGAYENNNLVMFDFLEFSE